MQGANLIKFRGVQENENKSTPTRNKNKNDNGKGKWPPRLHGRRNKKKEQIYRKLSSEAGLYEKLLHQR